MKTQSPDAGRDLHSSLAAPKSPAGVGTFVRIGWILTGCPDVKGPIPRSVLMSSPKLDHERRSRQASLCGAMRRGHSLIPPPSGEGDRLQGGGGGWPHAQSVLTLLRARFADHCRTSPPLAPSTILRMVPLPRWGRISQSRRPPHGEVMSSLVRAGRFVTKTTKEGHKGRKGVGLGP